MTMYQSMILTVDLTVLIATVVALQSAFKYHTVLTRLLICTVSLPYVLSLVEAVTKGYHVVQAMTPFLTAFWLFLLVWFSLNQEKLSESIATSRSGGRRFIYPIRTCIEMLEWFTLAFEDVARWSRYLLDQAKKD